MKRFISILTVAILSAVMLFSCGKSVQERWQEQLDLGMRYLEELDYESAILAFTKAIEVDPNRSEAYVERAKLYVQRNAEGDLALAAADYEKAIELGEETVDVFLALASIYEELGDLEKAIEIIQQGYDLTGAPELSEKLKELEARLEETEEPEEPEGSEPVSQRQPLEGYPKTERRDGGDGWHTMIEYDEFGQVVKETIYDADGILDSVYEYRYNDEGYLLQELYTNGNPAENSELSSITNYSGEASEWVLDETSYYNDCTYHCVYSYQGLEASISIWYEFPDGTVSVKTVIPYTMESEGNWVLCQVWSMYTDGTLDYVQVEEYADRLINRVMLNPDGSIHEF